MIKNYTIYGERCTGTNYLEMLMKLNFTIPLTWKYGFKHFPGFHQNKLKKSDETLFICIIRDPIKWVNSLYRNPHHIQIRYDKKMPEQDKINKFMNSEFWSYDDLKDPKERKEFFGHNEQQEIMEDRNIYTGQRYKNLFEARYTKMKFLIEDLPKLVKHCILIRYEDLINDFNGTMTKIKEFGIPMFNKKHFPVNTDKYKKSKKVVFDKNKALDKISIDIILNHSSYNSKLEQQMGYHKETKTPDKPDLKKIKEKVKNKKIKKKKEKTKS